MYNPAGDDHIDEGQTTETASVRSDPRKLRRWVAIAAVLAFGLNFLLAQASISDASGGDASAIQIIQVWTPHIYYAILITGVTVALYVYSRSLDSPDDPRV